MLNVLKNILFPSKENEEVSYKESKDKNQKKLQIATCALFVEMANADDNFTEEERKEIISIMESTFNLEEEYEGIVKTFRAKN